VSGSYWTQIGPKFQSYSWDISGAEWIDDINDLMGEDLIVSDPKIMMGKPVIAGTRITVEIILDKLAAGETVSQILASHPRLTEESIRAALAFASQALKADYRIPASGKDKVNFEKSSGHCVRDSTQWFTSQNCHRYKTMIPC
jgi:uncharacterized protein (DUF433 family)